MNGKKENCQRYLTEKLTPIEVNKVKEFILKSNEISHKSEFKAIRDAIIKELKKYIY